MSVRAYCQGCYRPIHGAVWHWGDRKLCRTCVHEVASALRLSLEQRARQEHGRG
jgi:hypothetical protein